MGVSLYGAREPDARRKPGRKSYDVKRLWQHNHEIINLSVLGLKNSQIASLLGVTEMTVSNTLNSTLGKEKVSLMRGARDAETFDAAKKIQVLAQKALMLYEQILDSEGEDSAPLGMKVNVSKHVVKDLSGLAVPTRIEGRFTHAHLTLEEIEELKRRGREAASQCGLLAESSR